MSRYLLVAAAAALSVSVCGCSPAARTAADEVVDVSVVACREAPLVTPLIPAPENTIAALVCAALEAGAPAIRVAIDSDVWDKMKAAHLAKFGSLPAGVSPPRAKP